VQVWLTAVPMDSMPSVDAVAAGPSMLRTVEHCKSLVVAGDFAALTYAEANLPSFSSGEKGCNLIYCISLHPIMIIYVMLYCVAVHRTMYYKLHFLHYISLSYTAFQSGW